MSADNNPSGQSDVLRLVALGAAAPQIHELRDDRVTIGAVAGNDLLLNEPTVSRRHAALQRRAGRWHVVDLGSTNGTYLNGRRVVAASPAPLERGDELHFGNARFGFVAPGDDLSKVGAGRNQAPARAPRRVSRRAGAALAVVALFAVGGFALPAYLLKSGRLDDAGSGTAAHSASVSLPAVAPPVGEGPESAAGSAGGALGAAPGVGAAPVAAAPQWLARLNYYRAMLRLAPVNEDPALSEGDTLHARYLVESHAAAIKATKIGADAHQEDRSSPWYSDKGARAASSSDVSYWQASSVPVKEAAGGHAPPSGAAASEAGVWDSPAEMPWGSPGWSIDGWIGIPFHRLSLISPFLRRSGYGRYCKGSACAAGLDTLSDLARFPVSPVPFARPLEFPPAGATIGMRSLDLEWPEPLTACPGYARPVGFPVTLEIGANVEAHLGDYRIVRDGASAANLQACGFDASSYTNPDAVAQRRARAILRGFGAVVMIPRVPLERGASYTVAMTVNGREYKWRFSTSP